MPCAVRLLEFRRSQPVFFARWQVDGDPGGRGPCFSLIALAIVLFAGVREREPCVAAVGAEFWREAAAPGHLGTGGLACLSCQLITAPAANRHLTIPRSSGFAEGCAGNGERAMQDLLPLARRSWAWALSGHSDHRVAAPVTGDHQALESRTWLRPALVFVAGMGYDGAGSGSPLALHVFSVGRWSIQPSGCF